MAIIKVPRERQRVSQTKLILIVTAKLLFGPLLADAGTTFLTVDDRVTGSYFAPPSSIFTVNNSVDNILTIEVDAPSDEYGNDFDSNLVFAAGGGARLAPGRYETIICPDDAEPRPLLITGLPGYGPKPKKFLVKEITYSADNQIISLDILFGDFDPGEAADLVCEVMYNSAGPAPPLNHIVSSLTAYATQGQEFVYYIRATGPQDSFGAANLPPGLTVDPILGRIAGVPAATGTFAVGLEATDADGAAKATLNLTVTAAAVSTGTYTAFLVSPPPGELVTKGIIKARNRADHIWTATLLSGTQILIESWSYGEPSDYWSFRFSPPGGEAPHLGRYDLGSVVTPTEGTLSVTVSPYSLESSGGIFDIIEVCVDPVTEAIARLRATFSMETLTVIPVTIRGEIWYNATATITSPMYVTATGGDFFSYQIVTNIAGPFTYTAENLPAGLSLNQSTGVISGTPTVTGVSSIPLSVTGVEGSVADTLTLKLLPSQYLVNLSTRGLVRQGDDALIAGFIVDAPVPKRIALRALGTKLGDSELIVLGDPKMIFHTFSAQYDKSVENWMLGDQFEEIEALGLGTDYATDDILLEDCSPGASTAVVQPFRYGASGISLVELYDVEPDAPSRMVNLSTRGFVGTNDNVMIGGFILGGVAGSGGKLAVFAKGPSLSASGVPDVLADPTLDLYDSNGVLLAANDNWQDAQKDEIQATGLVPSDVHEAGVIIQLPLGAYTAIVRGKQGTSGIGLVEVYDLSSVGP